MTLNTSHPAVNAHLTSIRAAETGDKSAWLDQFAEDAWLQDPVGPSPYDPAGEGFRGRAAIEWFWDNVIAPAETTFDSRLRIPSGPGSCACWMVASNQVGGQSVNIDVMVIYHLNEQGKIHTLRAYWDLQAAVSAMTASHGE